jgi:hypothetical protein
MVYFVWVRKRSVKIFHNTSDHIVATQKKNVWSLQFEHFTILRVCENFQIQADWVTFHEATRFERRISYLKQVYLRWICLKRKCFFFCRYCKSQFYVILFVSIWYCFLFFCCHFVGLCWKQSNKKPFVQYCAAISRTTEYLNNPQVRTEILNDL